MRGPLWGVRGNYCLGGQYRPAVRKNKDLGEKKSCLGGGGSTFKKKGVGKNCPTILGQRCLIRKGIGNTDLSN